MMRIAMSPPPLVFTIVLSLAVVLKDGTIVIKINTDPILMWPHNGQKKPEGQLARPLAMAMNKDDYSELSHQLSSLFHRH